MGEKNPTLKELSEIIDPQQQPFLAQLLQEIRDNQHSIMTRLEMIDAANAKQLQDIAKLKSAFPGEDAEGHRRYHETMIALVDERRKLRMAIVEKTVVGCVWVAIAFVAVACWEALLGSIPKIITPR